MAAETPKKNATRARPAPPDAKARKARAEELAKKNVEALFGEGDPSMPPRVLVHGESGIGKTQFFSNVPGVVFLALEEGVDHTLPRYRGNLETYDDVMEALDFLHYGRHAYRFVVLETLADMERRIVDRVEARLRAVGGPIDCIAALNETERGAGYNLVRDEWQIVVDKLTAIWHDRKMGIGLTAHTKASTVAGLHGGPDHQRYEPQFSMSTGARSLIKGAVDALVFFATEVSTSKDAKTQKVTAHLGARWMYFRQEATHDAKCRGLVPWPRRAPLDVRDGWRTFSTLYRLIRTYGHGVGTYIFEEASKATHGLPPLGLVTSEQRAAKAMDFVIRALETHVRDDKGEVIGTKDADYLTAWDIVEDARAQSVAAPAGVATNAAHGTVAAPKSAAPTTTLAPADPILSASIPAVATEGGA